MINNIAAQQLLNVNGIDTAGNISKQPNTEAALTTDTRLGENSESSDDEVGAGIEGGESEDFQGNESD